MEGNCDCTTQRKNTYLKRIVPLVLMLIMVLTTIAVSVSAQEDPSEIDEDFFAAMMGICIVLIIIFLLIAIALSVWIYRDAEKRGKSGIVWAILMFIATLVFFPIGTIIIAVIWLVVRPPEHPPGMPYPYPPPQPGYPPQQPYYPPPQQPGYPPQQPPPY